MSYEDELKRQIKWSKKTFGPQARTEGLAKHLKKEADEVLVDPNLEEWIDCMIIAFDGAWRFVANNSGGMKLDEGEILQVVLTMYASKMRENKKRKWPDWREVGENNPIEHVK